MTDPEFVLDSSLLIKYFREQPPEIYVTLWQQLAELIDSGQAVVPREAAREIEHRHDDLHAWLKDRRGIVEATDDDLTVVATISGQHPAWVRGRKNAADPFVIAAAATRGAVVVTDEHWAGITADERNLKIPNVAHELGIAVLNPTEFVRRCGWRF